MTTIAINLVEFYRKFLRFLLQSRPAGLIVYSNCKFEPTCSEYAVESILKYGVLRGNIKIMRRLIKCGPWSKGGVDLP